MIDRELAARFGGDNVFLDSRSIPAGVWIRQEIAAAFELGLRVIPVLTDGGVLPAEVELPADIAALSRRQYVPMRRRYTRIDLDHLVEQITGADPELASAATKRRAGAERSRVPSWVPSAVGNSSS